jgi:hypothetical protein
MRPVKSTDSVPLKDIKYFEARFPGEAACQLHKGYWQRLRGNSITLWRLGEMCHPMPIPWPVGSN